MLDLAARISQEVQQTLDECSWGWWVANPEIHLQLQ